MFCSLIHNINVTLLINDSISPVRYVAIDSVACAQTTTSAFLIEGSQELQFP